MIKYGKRVERVVDVVVKDIICDGCKESCRPEGPLPNYEYAKLSASWGYYSPFDMQRHEAHFCAKCFVLLLEKMNISMSSILFEDFMGDELEEDEEDEGNEENGEQEA